MKKFFILLFILSPLYIFPQTVNSIYSLNTIDDDFLGTYLPVNYITSLYETRNHSISMHLNDRNLYHDVFSVNKNIIYSNLKWHDQYAIEAIDANKYQFIRNDNERIIIDNNGYSYKKIDDNYLSYNSVVQRFVVNVVFEEVIKQGIGINIADRTITMPFLYFFLNQNTFDIILDDMFFEKGANILLNDRLRQSMLYVSLEQNQYTFYEMTRDTGSVSNRSGRIIFSFNTDDDKRLLFAMAGLDENPSEEYLEYLNLLSEYDKRVIINAMFALNGYQFVSEQWSTFFTHYSWYKPNNEMGNNIEILNSRQRILYEYLNN